MSTHRHFDKICCVVLVLTLLLTAFFINAEQFGITKASSVMGYEKTLFDTSKVHNIDIVMDDWDEFIANCKSEEYYACTVVIDNKACKNVAIRAKGNTSLTQVESYGNNRYSFKVEFDHYDNANTYYGLDKLCLNNIIQDNTYMKDYLSYSMMNEMGVASPLCSYAYITVNGEDWGLYLAVEGVEESFLQRNYGKDYGELYKPDSMNMGGGRGNGKKFDMDEFLNGSESEGTDNKSSQSDNQLPGNTDNQRPGGMQGQGRPGGNKGGMPGGAIPDDDQDAFGGGQMPEGMPLPPDNGNNNFGGGMPGAMTPPDGFAPPDGMDIPEDMQGKVPGGMGAGMRNGSDDVLLKYIDDDIASYPNIFENAKTDITDTDKTRLIKALKKLNDGEDLDETVDVDAVIRYFVVHNFVLNFDSYTGSMIHNYYLYENNGQLQMIPWDYNLAFGGFQSAGGATSLVNWPVDSPVSGGNTEDRPMIAWIFENEEYTELYHKYFSEFMSEYFDNGFFEKMIDDVVSIISPYVEKDPTKFCTYEEFVTGASTLKKFCLLRAQSIGGQLDGTIGLTSDTQKTETLIDAGDVQISDMGSMGNMGGGKDKFNGDMQKPQNDRTAGDDTDVSGNIPSESSDADESNGPGDEPVPPMPDGSQGNFGGGAVPGGALAGFANGENSTGQGTFGGQMQSPGSNVRPDNNGQMQSPDGNSRPDNNGQMQPQGQDTVSASSFPVMGISVLALALGLVFAFTFKRRK